MASSDIKYSIILPSRNGGKYLPACVESVIRQNYDNYELIISDDHSKDKTEEYLKTIIHPKIRVVHPPEGLSMAEHWGWALEQSAGEWLIFVGQDDGLQPYFFKLADSLTKIAERKKIRTIMSERAYYFWPGCREYFGNSAVIYNAVGQTKILDWRFQTLRALLGFQNYFELPEMYTTSIFNRSIIEEARRIQKGKLFTAHPQDANLAAIGASLDKKYIKSMIPLGWVGSSPKSAGLAVVAEGLEVVREDYLKKVSGSTIRVHPLAGDFTIGSTVLYFWGALLQTQSLRKAWINRMLLSGWFKTLIFAGAYLELKSYKNNRDNKRFELFNKVLEINKCHSGLIKFVSGILRMMHAGERIKNVIFRNRFRKKAAYKAGWDDSQDMNLEKASREVDRLMMKYKLLDMII
jgi:glycosyltransferase involved in cell wall biosynthesis